MKIIVTAIFIMILTSTAWAEDTMNPVFERIDELITRIESGISLNSYAETLAQLKVDYKKAQSDGTRVDNPLLSSRMKAVMTILDDYAYVWRGQENEGYKFLPQNADVLSRHPDILKCAETIDYKIVYPIPCAKRVILDELNSKLERAKCAHVNGW
jgi:hypothetical protein